MYNLNVDFDELKLLRWTIQVAVNAVGLNSGDTIPEEEAMTLLAQLDLLDEKIVDQTTEEPLDEPEDQKEENNESTWEQLRLFDND